MVEIRSANADEYPLVAALSGEVGAYHAQAFPQIFKPDPTSQESFREFLADPDFDVLLLFADGEAAGLLIYEVVERPESDYFYAQRSLYVREMGVSPKHQRKGYGELLMDKAVEVARARGITRLTLRVWTFNEGAVSFYERIGFVPESISMVREI